MNKLKLSLALAIAGLVSVTAVVAADPVLDTWQPSVYFKANFGGQPKKNDFHFGAQMALTEQAVNRIYGGNTLLSAARAIKGDKTAELPAYLKLDYDSGKSLTTQWMGANVLRYDYGHDTFQSSLLNFTDADVTAMEITGGLVGAALLGWGISEWTSSDSNPAAAGGGEGAACTGMGQGTCAVGLICCETTCAAACK